MTSAPTAASPFRLDGQAALVTGAGSGIGRACALVLAGAGARVAATDRDAKAAAETAALVTAAGGEAVALPLDVAREASVVRGIGKAVDRLGRLDVLVNNAGVGKRGPAIEVTRAEWDRIIGINLTGAFLCAREAAKAMLPAGRGAIVNIASIMGLLGNPFYGHIPYHTAKGGIVNLTRTLAVEWAPRAVRVNAVAPAFVRTALTDKLLTDRKLARAILAATPMGRLPTPEEIAQSVLFLASPAAGMITGQILAVDGGWTAR